MSIFANTEMILIYSLVGLCLFLALLYWVISEATRSKEILSELRKIKRIERLRAEHEGIDKSAIENELSVGE